jgi:hypothetical protein
MTVNAVYKHNWRLVRRIFLYFHQLVHFSQGEFEGVFPKDLRRRTATRTKFGAHFLRTFFVQIDLNFDLVQNDPKNPFVQQFGKDLVKQLSIYVLVYLKL